MKVDIGYYFYFWSINSLMAAATGFAIGIMALGLGGIGILIMSPISFPVVFILIYQFYLFVYLWGNRRGEFEYSFLEKSAMQGEHGQAIKARLKEVRHDLKWCDKASAHAKLTSILKDYPNDFVLYFKYAGSCEVMGMAEEAISAYKVAEKLIPVTSKFLNNYVVKQISRVQKNGPSKSSSTPGLSFIIY